MSDFSKSATSTRSTPGLKTVEAHILEQRLNGGKFALTDDEIAADVQKNVAEPAFDATAAKTLAIDLAVTVRRNENGLGPVSMPRR